MENNDLKNIFSESEWEQLCDRCGICCFYKLEDADTNEIFYTRVVCPLFDAETSLCVNYAQRFDLMPSCVKIAPETMERLNQWLPWHCAYRCVYERRPLPVWHPIMKAPVQNADLLKKIEARCTQRPVKHAGLSIDEIQRVKNIAVKAILDDQFDNQLIENVLLEKDLTEAIKKIV
jgi:uncharacterized cysteine cluster protein YcgN (CxxCxxCC family)